MGSCTAGGAYVPAMSDETVIVAGDGTIFLGGPPLVKAATGEVVTAEELGGADVHTRISGVADHYAIDDEHALAIVRAIVANLAPPPDRRRGECRAARARPTTRRELYGIVPRDPRTRVRRARGYRAHRRRRRASTSSRRSTARRSSAVSRTSRAIRSGSSPTTASCSRESALKGTHFIELCTQRGTPLLFLQNITGFMVGKEYENAASPRTAPSWSWRSPARRCRSSRSSSAAVVRRRQLRDVRARVLAAPAVDVAQRAHLGDGRRAGRVDAARRCASKPSDAEGRDADRRRAEAFKAPILEKYEREGNPYYSTARLWDDGIIDPVDTRRVLALGLECAAYAPPRETRFGVFRM